VGGWEDERREGEREERVFGVDLLG